MSSDASDAPGPRGAAGPAARTGTGYRAVFAVREFRAVFAAHVLSLLGNVVAQLALAVLVLRETGSPLLTALAFAIGLLPYALGGTLLAPLADRFPARRTLVGCDLLCAVCVAAMAVPGVPTAALLALRALTALVAPLFTGVRAASLGEVLHGDSFVLGRSLLRLVAQSGQIAGFAAGGLLLAAVGPRTALAATAAGFAASAAVLRFGTRERRPPARERTAGGAGALPADRRVRALLGLCWVPPVFMVVPEALAAPYARQIGTGPAGTGLLLAAMPLGAVAGEAAAGALLGPAARERLVLPAAVLLPLPLVAFAWRPALVPALAALVLTGLCAVYALGLDRWYLDAVPRELRGRAMTVMSAGLMTTQGLGMAAGGAAAEWAPPHAVVAGAGLLGTVCAAAAAWFVRMCPVSRIE
ncbi:MFS transporter [Streptomyces desertarenae]|uniref:MFS transporter n=1 Tax=Streptomyces desertarenae TaxID=2666184 RepID=A0ABW4PIZ0_9ACTN